MNSTLPLRCLVKSGIQGNNTGGDAHSRTKDVNRTPMRTSLISLRLPSLTALIFAALVVLVPRAAAQELTPPPPPLQSPAVPTSTPAPRPAPALTLTEGPFTLDLYFRQIQQGDVGLVRVSGGDIASVRGSFMGTILEFLPGDDGHYGLLAVNMDALAREETLSVVVSGADDTRTTFSAPVRVTIGGFITQTFNIQTDRAYLLDTSIERDEFARLEAIFSPVTPRAMWGAAGFFLPINAELTSPFGAFRTLNDSFLTRHTGWDLRAATGTPISASGGGQIAFAGVLDIRGNYVVIDHGYGVFTGYAHLSQVHVTRGQSVVAGQIIGVSGNTGRSNGPHLHWELVVNGEWVNALSFLEMWLP